MSGCQGSRWLPQPRQPVIKQQAAPPAGTLKAQPSAVGPLPLLQHLRQLDCLGSLRSLQR